MELEEIKKLNIYEKLQLITNEVGYVSKNLEVGVGKNKYNAVGEADILKAVKEKETQYRVYSYPISREIVETNNYTTTSTYNDEVKEKLQLFMRIKVVYRFVNIDKPDEYIEITSFGDGVDSQDKCPGKAMTYADKYALMKAYKIITGDDPDQNESKPMEKAIKVSEKMQQAIKVSEKMQQELKSIGGTLELAAKFYNCSIFDLTDLAVKQIINMKKKQLFKEKQTDVEI